MVNISFRKIFFPYADKEIQKTKSESSRFAYYTTAEVAFSILKNQCIWMRSCSTMNDYLEVKYGQELLLEAIKNKSGTQLKNAVNACHADLFEKAWNLFQAWLPGFRYDTYLTCVSKHSNDEDDIGRLSMWRAYGGKTGVALIFKGDSVEVDTSSLGIYASPVAYLNHDQFCHAMEDVANNIDKHCSYIKTLPEERVKDLLFSMLKNSVICTKHPGFCEEKEWRIIHSPVLNQSDFVKKEIQIVKGVPQIICKIPFDKGIEGLTLTELIDRVIIGPCEFPDVTYQAICSVLSEAGMTSPEQIITKSEIPLRQS